MIYESEYMMDEIRIEGLWDCAYCDKTQIKARYDSCPSCGKARGIETVFYMPDDISTSILTQEEKEKTSNRADWLCEYCGAFNSDNNSRCSKCGSDKKESKKDYGTLHKLTGLLFGRK